MVQEEMRRGPWTEQEDVQLVLYVNMFGDRRWDFLANVSGLKRSGKSCRLRWVNYLHPDLKRGKMTSQEERLILQLHSKWGNRWSKIARKLPGRTDNEIKNYWRTHTRKKAHEDRTKCGSSSLSNSSSSSSSSSPAVDSWQIPETNERNFNDTGGVDGRETPLRADEEMVKMDQQVYSLDDIWKDMELWPEEETKIKPGHCGEQQKVGSMIWNYWSDWVWMNMDCNQGQRSNKGFFVDNQDCALMTG